jgi:hypothetical protein
MSLAGISWVAVIVAVVANMILGFLWYGPLFGKQWMKAVGKSESEIPQNPTMYVVPVVATLVMAIVLWNVMQATGLSGIVAGFWMWLGFTALTGLTNDVFRGTGTTLWAIENLNHLVSFVLTGLILTLL